MSPVIDGVTLNGLDVARVPVSQPAWETSDANVSPWSPHITAPGVNLNYFYRPMLEVGWVF